ncbi:MAG: hypothetical protein J7498_08310 [Sphingobium sp.]|nr:hypothetical protein [Sphingobium sp.]
MTIQTASQIVQRLGPCRIAIDPACHDRLARELALLGCETVDTQAASGAGRTAGFLAWTYRDTSAFGEALKPYADMDALILQSAGQPRHGFEEALFGAGWQRHPAGMMIGDYSDWTSYALPTLSYYTKVSSPAGGPLRQGGADADARIARYAMAATMARPGDTVLIDGADAEDGAAIFAALSRAGHIRVAGTDLSREAGNAIDMIIAFEPCPATDWLGRLDDFARIIKCDGRLVLGWKRGTAPNRPADWAALDEAVGGRFIAETRYRQAMAGGDPGGPRMLYPVPLAEYPDSDWLLLVAAANPLTGEGRKADYDHPAFPKAKGPWPELAAFGAAYDNPYLYRAMVQMGERIGDEAMLARVAECVIEDSRPDSADRGAAIAVLGYRILEMRQEGLVPAIMPLIADYVDLPVDDAMAAHVRRWRISLAFLAGRLNELIGERALAHHCYRIAAEADWAAFSPLLATKSIAASFYEARLCLAEGDTQSALACFHEGLDTALKVTACPHEKEMGSTEQPLPFYLTELAEVIDMGSQCANAIAHFHLWTRDPGLFWRQVDIRRFGLASWARDLERENKRLRG